MISLNPQLHVWWSKAYFAFKCLGIVETDDDKMSLVQIQFHWISKATTLWKRDEQDEDKLRDYLTGRGPLESGVLAFYTSGRPVTSGDTFELPVKTVRRLRPKERVNTPRVQVPLQIIRTAYTV